MKEFEKLIARMNGEVEVGIETLIVMFVVAFGKQSDKGFTYYPKLPSEFAKVKFAHATITLRAIRVNLDLGLEFWFVGEDGVPFSLSLDFVRENPMLFASIITHIYDKI